MRKSVLNKKSKKPLKKLKAEADRLFSIYVRLRDNNECITCGSKNASSMQAGHFMSRRFNNTRFEEENVNAQCLRCNLYNHGEQYKYAKALEFKYGDGTADKLEKMAQVIHKFTREELEQIIEDCKTQIAFYSMGN